MSVTVGIRLPEAKFALFSGDELTSLSTADICAGRRVVIFALPGAYTGTCDALHVPSFVRTADRIRAKGVDAIYCMASNDVSVMRRWGETSGATGAGIIMLTDIDGAYAKALGLQFSNLAEGLMNRSRRYSMLVEDGVVAIYNAQIEKGCEISGGETMLSQL